jgi:sugar phosphate isomerase/epimerase
MSPIRLAVATRCLNLPLLAALKRTSDWGVAGVQLDLRSELAMSDLTDTGRRQLLHRINELSLTVAGAVFPLSHPLSDETELDRRVTLLQEAMKNAFSLKAGVLCCKVGRIPTERDSKAWRLLVEVVNDLARYGNHIGTILCITPTNDAADDLMALVGEIKAGPIGIDFDPAHFAMTGQSSIDSLRLLHAHVRHVQLRDGLRDFTGGGQEAPLGQGTIDWREHIALLGEMDYRGWLTALRTQGEDRPTDTARAIKYIRQLVPGL